MADVFMNLPIKSRGDACIILNAIREHCQKYGDAAHWAYLTAIEDGDKNKADLLLLWEHLRILGPEHFAKRVVHDRGALCFGFRPTSFLVIFAFLSCVQVVQDIPCPSHNH